MKTRFLPISTIDGTFIGWIKPELVVRVSAGSGQRAIVFNDRGVYRDACRKYGFSDTEFMSRLGLDGEETA